MFGLIVTLIVLTSINFSKINQLSNATKAFLDTGINQCTDSYTQIPTDQYEVVYGAKNDAKAALIATLFIGIGFTLQVTFYFCAICANGWKKSCECDRY